jgi:hypothetical protein
MVANTKAAMAARIGSVLMLRKNGEAETSNEVVTALQGPNGGLTIEPAAGSTLVDVSTLATQVTAAAILAKLIAAPSTEAKQDDLIAKVVGAFSATTPTKTSGTAGALELDERGNLHASMVLAHSSVVVLQGPETDALTAAEIAAIDVVDCDGVECNDDEIYIYAQLREDPRLAPITAAGWTAGDGWTFAGTIATHDDSAAYTDDLETVLDVAHIGIPYAVLYTISGMSAGTLTEKIGTAGATARTVDGTYVAIIIPTVDGQLRFTPTDDFDGGLDIENVWVLPFHELPSAGTPKPIACSKIACFAAKEAPTAKVISPATACIRTVSYRRAGAVQS